MNADALEIRAFRAGDETGINDSFNLAHGTDRSLEAWSWRFPTSPEGRPIIVARRGGRVVAHLAGVASRLELNGRLINAAAVVDPFVLPETGGAAARAELASLTTRAFVEEFGPGRRFDLVYRLQHGPADGGADGVFLGEELAQPEAATLLRRRAGRAPWRRLAYRAEPARDWEPRLDDLWRRARRSFPAAVVRDAGYALDRHAGHPTERRHRFVVLPRFGRRAVAFAVFDKRAGECRWLDLVWDHAHPGALELLAHLSGRLAIQIGASCERLLVGGDSEGRARLESLGFALADEQPGTRLAVLACASAVDPAGPASRFYLTAADLEGR